MYRPSHLPDNVRVCPAVRGARQASPRQIASKRGLKVQDIIARRTDGSGNAEVA